MHSCKLPQEMWDAVPCPSWPFGGPASYPAAVCAYASLHEVPAEPQLSTPFQM
jgi:hypothetical protein